MELTAYVDALRAELDAAAAAGTPEVADAAARLARVLDPATRLVLLDAIGAAAAEVNVALADRAHDLDAVVSVDVRLHGRSPELVVDLTPTDASPPPAAVPSAAAPLPDEPPADEVAVARVTVRVPEQLKAQVEDAAAATGMSVNAWITRVLADAVDTGAGPGRPPGGPTGGPGARLPSPDGRSRGGRRIQGWVR